MGDKSFLHQVWCDYCSMAGISRGCGGLRLILVSRIWLKLYEKWVFTPQLYDNRIRAVFPDRLGICYTQRFSAFMILPSNWGLTRLQAGFSIEIYQNHMLEFGAPNACCPSILFLFWLIFNIIEAKGCFGIRIHFAALS